MDSSLVAAFVGITAGAIGYWLSTFAVQPILKFREVRFRIHSEFIYYAQVIKADGFSDEMKTLHRERILANRRSSAQLSAAYLELPCWYRYYLGKRGMKPQHAVRRLIGFSNTTEYDAAHEAEDAIKRFLNIPREI